VSEQKEVNQPGCPVLAQMFLGELRRSWSELIKSRVPSRYKSSQKVQPLASFGTDPVVDEIIRSLNRRISVHDRNWWFKGGERFVSDRLSIVVVGNGPIGLLGSEIDSADVVVRINQAKRHELTHLVGNKIDIRITSPETLLDTDRETLERIPHLLYNPYRIDLYSTLPPILARLHPDDSLKRLDALSLPDGQYRKSLKRQIGCQRGHIPSTGAAAVRWALDIADEKDQVSIVGFNTAVTVSGPLWAHYWDSPAYLRQLAEDEATRKSSDQFSPRRPLSPCEWLRRWAVASEQKHDMQRERAWLRKLIASGQIRNLEPDVPA